MKEGGGGGGGGFQGKWASGEARTPHDINSRYSVPTGKEGTARGWGKGKLVRSLALGVSKLRRALAWLNMNSSRARGCSR